MTYTVNNPAASAERLVRLREVQHRVGLGRSAIYDQIKRGVFPAPVHVGTRAVAWASTAIDAWIQARIDRGGGHV